MGVGQNGYRGVVLKSNYVCVVLENSIIFNFLTIQV